MKKKLKNNKKITCISANMCKCVYTSIKPLASTDICEYMLIYANICTSICIYTDIHTCSFFFFFFCLQQLLKDTLGNSWHKSKDERVFLPTSLSVWSPITPPNSSRRKEGSQWGWGHWHSPRSIGGGNEEVDHHPVDHVQAVLYHPRAGREGSRSQPLCAGGEAQQHPSTA
jgi:hypothetical protein